MLNVGCWMRGKIKFLLLFLPLLVFGNDLLRDEKQSILDFSSQSNQINATKLRYNWVSPIELSWKYSKSNDVIINGVGTFDFTSRDLRVSLNQPIFRSGGIWYGVDFANIDEDVEDTVIHLQKVDLLRQIYSLALLIQKSDLWIKKQEYQISTSDIDVQKKKELYESGLLDIVFLNDALLHKNQLKLTLEDLKEQRSTNLSKFKKLSDKSYKNLGLVDANVTLKEFISSNTNLKLQTLKLKQSKTLQKLRLSDNLLSVSVNANYGRQNLSGSKSTNSGYGLSASIPLFDINKFKDYQNSKITVLREKAQLQEDKRDKVIFYENIQKRRQYNQNKIQISKQNTLTQQELLKYTKERLGAGDSTNQDVMVAQNSYDISLLDEQIYKLDLEFIKLDLWSEMY